MKKPLTIQDLIDIDNGVYICADCKEKESRRLDYEHSSKGIAELAKQK